MFSGRKVLVIFPFFIGSSKQIFEVKPWCSNPKSMNEFNIPQDYNATKDKEAV